MFSKALQVFHKRARESRSSLSRSKSAEEFQDFGFQMVIYPMTSFPGSSKSL
ncbi:hypothetical protein BATR1942_02800 [Bacillus atrophaeus 1942]|uniref:Uncharacterized protein n=1 Tax=Bacillus atrophaeus (strain 1942) TaxID=720555 RepID=A0ABM5LUG4_BACA1|nr:hypothetical protein BATR1942_02800 [Bacillus atrophaeus 1942]EIM10211.1 hypothetical protein UY9_13821 [Bacillus atrophaeus C89]